MFVLLALLASCGPPSEPAVVPVVSVPAPPPAPATTDPPSPPPVLNAAALLRRIVDRSLSDDEFTTAVADFEAALPPVDRTTSSHEGQTDYTRQRLGPYDRVSSTTWYNSSNAELRVTQLVRDGRVIFYSYQGGDHHLEPGLIAAPDGQRTTTLAGPLSAWYDYESGVGVVIRQRLVGWPFPSQAPPQFRMQLRRSWFTITPENEPRVFVESH